ncbi:murein biosynthesis integral membrane protein MurJ [Isachenkonia alkalipeptolytica]|uniref:Probable lipid II flippase MurJ n=1 Tax=Isachenkonia alkalipeptolytica TaxID=2565777 RepID=A0AA43XK85_9CLOT|nr:murein biosynthesis integral membrane protein MurJ [Isachenkonia alkalipeptolytica]NBG88373.1 murein biosynthesis integral membrane protein MurJ [Isachenkonia alkalipeptolytica]
MQGSRLEKATKSAILVMVLTSLSKIMGFLREMLIGFRFGLGGETDAFFMALTINGVLITIIALALRQSMIPIFTGIRKREGDREENRYLSRFSLLIFIGALGAIGVFYVAAPFLVSLFAGGFEEEVFDFTVRLVRIGLPSMVAVVLTDVFNAYIHSKESFAFPALMGIPFNIPYFIFLIFMGDQYGLTGLMITAVIANVLQWLLTMGFGRKIGWRYDPKTGISEALRDQNVKRTFRFVGPVILGTMVSKFNVVVDRALASGLISGSVSALNYAEKVKALVYGVFILSIVTIIYPILSREGDLNNPVTFNRMLLKGMNVMLLLTIPVAAGTLLLAEPMIRVLFQRGEFDAWSTGMTAYALSFYAIGFVGIGLREMMIRGFYSLQDTKTPMENGIYVVALNIALNLLFVPFFGHGGLALGTSIASLLGAYLLLKELRKKMAFPGGKKMLLCAGKSCAASLVMAGAILGVAWIFGTGWFTEAGLYQAPLPELLMLFMTILLGAAVYLLMLFFFNIEEVEMVKGLVFKK